MAMSAEHRSKFAAVTSPYEWKNLEWDDKLQNKQKNQINIKIFLVHKKVYY